MKAAADTLLAAPKEGEVAAEKPESIANDLPKSTVIVTDIYEVGGSEPNPLHFEFTHTPKYAAAYYCQLDKEKFDTAFRSTCDTSQEAKGNAKVLLLEKDLGSLRQPPLFLFLGSSVLFVIFLLSMHWREKDANTSKSGDSSDDDSKVEEKEKELVDA